MRTNTILGIFFSIQTLLTSAIIIGLMMHPTANVTKGLMFTLPIWVLCWITTVLLWRRN